MNQRGEYGDRGASPPRPRARTGAQSPRNALPPETRRAITSHVVIGAGLFVGVMAWPLYARQKRLGVIALGASGSLVSAGIVGLLLGDPYAGLSS